MYGRRETPSGLEIATEVANRETFVPSGPVAYRRIADDLPVDR